MEKDILNMSGKKCKVSKHSQLEESIMQLINMQNIC